MRNRTTKLFSVTSLAFSLLFLSCLPVRAALAPAGHVILADGPFIAIQTNASARSLSRGSEFYQGDRLWTGPRTRAQIRFSDGAIMTLRPDTEFSVDEYEFDQQNADNNKSFFTLLKGGFRTLTGLISKLRPDGYRVKTAYAIVGVRGTTYEVVDQNALYVAAWEGTISVSNNSAEMLLGFGQDFNYATVTSINSAPTGSVEVPPALQQPPDPGLQQAMVDPTETRLATAVSDPIEDVIPPRLSTTEVASLDRSGFATSGGASPSFASLSAIASDGASGDPLFWDLGQDIVLRRDVPAGTDTVTTLSSFPVSFGNWNGAASPAVALPDEFGTVVPVVDPVYWITLGTPTALPTGSVSYFSVGPVLTGVGGGSAGSSISLNRFEADVDFGTGALTNGELQVDNGTNSWDGFFTGTVGGGNFTASLDPGQSTVSDGTTTSSAQGTLDGSFAEGTGGISGIGGIFDFEQAGDASVHVEGAFFAREDRRFSANELASLNQVGIAATSSPTATAPFVGEASDGAGGSPIVFDVAGNEVLRQGTAPLLGSVTTDTTLGPGFAVSWGAWNASVGNEASIQGDPNTATPTQLISDPVYWITAAATPAASLPTGTFTYGTVLGFQGDGEAGPVNALAMNINATLNLGTGAITNGTMSVQNGPRVSGFVDQWIADLGGGSFSAGQLDVNVTTGTVSVDGAAPVGGVTGTVNGVLTGPNGEGLAGGFNLQQGATNHVDGTFLVTQ